MTCRSIIVAFLFILNAVMCYAQTGRITGRVLDAQSGQPLPYASVYVNLTTLGTTADDKGEFAINNLQPGRYDLVISYIGHKPQQKNVEVLPGGENVLRISLQLTTLKAVEIVAKRDPSWFKQLEKFKGLFLGQGPATKLCKIINPHTLSFSEDKTMTFFAQSADPIEVDNMYLGYRVTYDLKNFAVNKQKYLVAGYIRFQEMQTTDSLLAKKWTQNRMKAYEGSVSHFFKSITEGQLAENGYEIYDDRSGLTQIVRNSRFLPNLDKTIFSYSLDGKVTASEDSSTFKVRLPLRTEIHSKNFNEHSKIYWDIPYPVSWIEVRGGELDISRDGLVLNPLMMTISGQMFEGRIDNLLPNNYHPKIKKRVYKETLAQKRQGALAFLAEKPYLHTDRSYFYPGENLWFKAYMNYTSPVVKDSLSRVLYVDVVSVNNQILISNAFQVANGLAVGDLEIPAITQPGDYTLRAYTRWMLNFDTAFVFTKSIKVLSYSESVRQNTYTPPENTRIDIKSDKDEFMVREKIALTIDIKDELENAAKANLSISVTDFAQAAWIEEETSILTHFNLPRVDFPDSLDKSKRLTIQNGFDLKGQFTSSKGKSVSGVLNFVQEGVANGFLVSTNEDGHFFLPDLLLYDTSKISYVARTVKGGYGTAVFDSTTVRPSVAPSPPLKLEIVKSESTVRRPTGNMTMKATMLRAVTIKDKRIEVDRSSIISSDYTISGDWLRERHSTDVLNSIQAKVPGLRIMVSMGTGYPEKYIILSGAGSFSGNSEPLVLVDGQSVNNVFGGPAQFISSMNPNEIERIEVSKFGSAAVYGARGGNGVIAIYTRTSGGNAIDPVEYDKSKLKPLRIGGFSSPNQFASPDYSNPESLKGPADNRATIYWNPSLTSNGKDPLHVEFYAADNATQYRIVVEGVTSDGRTVRGEKIIKINKTP